MNPISRRRFLGGTAAFACVSLIGACSKSKSSTGTSSPAEEPTSTTTGDSVPAGEVGVPPSIEATTSTPTTFAPQTTLPAPPSTAPAAPGDVMGTLDVPGLGTFDIVESEADQNGLIVEESLNVAGVAHHAGTTPLGERGVTVIAGHRTSGTAPFNKIDRIALGDVLTVTTAAGFVVKYKVVDAKVVAANDDAAVAEVLDNAVGYGSDSRLNLYSCSKADGAPTSTAFRYVVFAIRV